MKEREAKDVVTPELASDGAGVRLKRSIATRTLDHLDPFFLFQGDTMFYAGWHSQ